MDMLPSSSLATMTANEQADPWREALLSNPSKTQPVMAGNSELLNHADKTVSSINNHTVSGNIGERKSPCLQNCGSFNSDIAIHRADLVLPKTKAKISDGFLCLDADDYTPVELGWGFCLLGFFAGKYPGNEAIEKLISKWTTRPKVLYHPKGWIVFRFETEIEMVAASVRVSNELGRADPKTAKFAIANVATISLVIGVILFVFFLFLRGRLAYIFTEDTDVAAEVAHLSPLLALSILMNSVQPVLSGVAIGAGLQSIVVYVNLGCYYLVGIPFGLVLGYVINLQVELQIC